MTIAQIKEMSNDDLILQIARISQLSEYRKHNKLCVARVCAELHNRGIVSDSFVKSCADCLEL